MGIVTDALFLHMAEILNIKLKNENFAIVEFDSGVGLVVPKLLVYELGLRKGDILGEEALDSWREKTNFTVVNKGSGLSGTDSTQKWNFEENCIKKSLQNR